MKEEKYMSRFKVHSIIYTALMAAIVYVLTLLKVPLGASMVHCGNAASMLAALLLGPWLGGLASGIGAFFFDLTHSYGIVEALVTFASKFLMAMVAGMIAGAYKKEGNVLQGKGASAGRFRLRSCRLDLYFPLHAQNLCHEAFYCRCPH